MIAVALVAMLAVCSGAFFVAGPHASVSAAQRDLSAAVDEARSTAAASLNARLSIVPTAGGGFTARVSRLMPGSPDAQPLSGPAAEARVALAETAIPLGSPPMTLTFAADGSVVASTPDVPLISCPSGGAFAFTLGAGNEAKTLSVPCLVARADASPVVIATLPPLPTPSPVPTLAVPVCTSSVPCALASLVPASPPASAAPHLLVEAIELVALGGSGLSATPLTTVSFAIYNDGTWASGPLASDTWACAAGQRVAGPNPVLAASNLPVHPLTASQSPSFGLALESTLAQLSAQVGDGFGDGSVEGADLHCP
jgi:hypothetical protein